MFQSYVSHHSLLDNALAHICQIANPSVAALYEDALVYETGSAITASGALSAYSGAKTGRSPSDKRIVKEPGSEKDIWWGPVNKSMTPEVCCIAVISEIPPLSIVLFLAIICRGCSANCRLLLRLVTCSRPLLLILIILFYRYGRSTESVLSTT